MKKQEIGLSSKDVDEELEFITLANLVTQEKFLDKTIKLLGNIGSKVFSGGAKSLIYETLVKMREEGKPIDPQTVKIRLRKGKVPDSVCDVLFDLTTSSELVPWTLIEEYLKELKSLATKRGRRQEAEKYLMAINNGKDPVKAKEELDQGISEIEAKTEKIKVGMNALESLSSPIKEKLCSIEGGLFAPERYTLFGASDGEGKTSLMVQLSFNAITGTPFLGVFPIPQPIDVLHISGENSRGDLNKKWEMALFELEKLKGNEARKYLENLQVCYPSEVDIQLDKKGGTSWLETQLKEYSPDLLILDSLCQVLSSETSLNDDITARRAGESLNRISRDFNCMVIITTHLRKPTETESKALSETKGGKMYDSIPGGISLLFHGSRYFTNLAVSKVAMYRKDRIKFERAKWLEFKFKIAESPPNLLIERDRETLWCKETVSGELSKLLPKDIIWVLKDKCKGRAVPTIFIDVVMEALNCGKTQAKELIKLAIDQGLIEKGKEIKDKGLLLSRLEDVEKRGKGGAEAKELALE
jgi:hypothetical protein